MDIRIEKTKSALRDAFLTLRSEKPTEKISVKELCALARVNKSTFYAHYRDIYDLSEAIEIEVIQEMLATIPSTIDYSAEHPEIFTKEIMDASISHLSTTMQLFTETDIHHLGKRMEDGIRELIYSKYPEYRGNPKIDVLLTFCIMGAHYAYWNHTDMDHEVLTTLIVNMIQHMGPLLKS